MSTIYYLYIKEHTKTGLKYLEKTQAKDPFKYTGSGKYWKRHLYKHGPTYNTKILLMTCDKDELIETGKFFSNLFNIVGSPDWANLKIEEGDGGWAHINQNKEN